MAKAPATTTGQPRKSKKRHAVLIVVGVASVLVLIHAALLPNLNLFLELHRQESFLLLQQRQEEHLGRAEPPKQPGNAPIRQQYTRTLSSQKFYAAIVTLTSESVQEACWLIQNLQWVEQNASKKSDSASPGDKPTTMFLFVVNQTVITHDIHGVYFSEEGQNYTQPGVQLPAPYTRQHYGATPATDWVDSELQQLCGHSSSKLNDQSTVDLTRVHTRELAPFPIQFGPMRLRAWSIAFQRLRLFDPQLYRPSQDDSSENDNRPTDITILSMDLDLLIRKDISNLLELKTHAIVGWQTSKSRKYATEPYVNAGVMVIRPNAEDYELLLKKAEQLADPQFPDILPTSLRLEKESQGGKTSSSTLSSIANQRQRQQNLWQYRETILKSSEQSFLHWVFDGFSTARFLHLGPTYNLILPYCEFGAHEELRDDFAIVHSAVTKKFWQRPRGYRRTPCIGEYNDEWHDLHPGVKVRRYVTKKKAKIK